MVCNKHDMETKNDGVQHKIMTTKYMKTVFALLVDCRVCCLFESIEFSTALC